MHIIKFDYLARPYLKNNKLTIIYRPIIPIRISANHKIYPKEINCFIDSGADFNLMPAFIGEYFGLSIKKGDKETHIGIGNVGIISYRHTVNLYIGSHKFKSDMHFSYDHKIPILGRYGFFNLFQKVIFNETNVQLELHYK